MTKPAEALSTIHSHLNPQTITEDDRLGLQDGNKLIPGTGTWLLEKQAFVKWVDSKTLVLSLSGGPGCGKSHLSTLAIEYKLQKAKHEGPRAVSVGYYYFHDNDPRTQSLLNAIPAIVYKIAEGDELFCMNAAEACR